METYIKEMTEIVEEHYKANHESAYPINVRLQSYANVNYGIYAIFHVGIGPEMCLYEVIYLLDFDEFRVLCYKFNERFEETIKQNNHEDERF